MTQMPARTFLNQQCLTKVIIKGAVLDVRLNLNKHLEFNPLCFTNLDYRSHPSYLLDCGFDHGRGPDLRRPDLHDLETGLT